MAKTYLITGGAGFIGSHYVLHLLKKCDDACVVNIDKLTYAGSRERLQCVESDPRYRFVQGDICEEETLVHIFREYDPDYVVNFAAESHVDRSIELPLAFAQANALGTVNLLERARQRWTQENDEILPGRRFVQISTDEVYGSLSLDEPDMFFREDMRLDPHSPYSASKAAADMFVMAYGRTFGLPVNIVRSSNVYGPFQFPEKMIPVMIRNALMHDVLPIYGDGLNVRDWLYVDDLCRAIDMVVEMGACGEVYNVGGHNEHSNISVARMIVSKCAAMTEDPAISYELISFVEDRKGHDRRYGIDPSKVQTSLGWSAQTSFEEGLSKTIEWYLSHREWLYGAYGRGRDGRPALRANSLA